MAEWREVVGYEGLYEVSNEGEIKSVARISPQNHFLKERIRLPETDKNGYKIVNLCKDGKVKLYKIHRLVGEAFIDNPNEYSQINHLDGNKANNNADNLEWCSASQNIQHAFNTGLKTGRSVAYYGEKNPHCKLDDEQCDEIRQKRKEFGYTYVQLADMYNVGPTQIARIIHNEQRVKGSVVIDH